MSPEAYSMLAASPLTNGTTSLFSTRKQREFIPDSKKDDSYWDRRRRNNEAAKRSREKRRISDMVLESRVVELTRENAVLKAELHAMKEKFGLPLTQPIIDAESVTVTLPESTCRGRRNNSPASVLVNISNGNGSSLSNHLIGNLTSSLPHKLRHKARTNTTNDSDSGSDSNGNPPVECGSNGFNGQEVAAEKSQLIAVDNNLKAENSNLRSELQRLASEVNSLKNFLSTNGNTRLSCNGLRESRSPLSSDTNDSAEKSVRKSKQANENG
ncbi:ras guanine nucleotide exchange factor B-like isoform X2 [Dinothrombium tinctorium]|uniref:Ras guanine nucleotide exchange factor B-like isoform X2 n=2 Tax=Dinothrombium tinctorium TaxID=1965070 RepID=A0A3S4QCH9_9ACAR|nr:ras guanine nucleotide exchange factor B-like isoform X2 [Dinothrombium tinctorium]RWS01656.1 ras guanine nucleotide exchange factor B-like isoform X2 [Dinothrombium tinctorium]